MQVFKAYMKILKKLIPSLSIYIMIFIILNVLLSGSGKENQVSEFAQSKINIAVFNEDEGDLGEELKNYLGKIHNLVEIESDKETVQDELYYRSVEYVLYIPKDFSVKIKEGNITNLCENVKVPSSYTGKYLDTQVNQYIATLSSYLITDITPNQAVEYTNTDLSKEVKIELLSGKTSVARTNDYFYFKYLPYVLISVVVMGISPILMVFNQKGIYERNLCCAIPMRKRSVELILGCIVTVMSIFFLFMLLAVGIHAKTLDATKVFWYVVNCIPFLLTSTGIGYSISIFVTNNNVVNMITNVLALGMSFLGGIFVPREILGDGVLAFSRFLPTYWYINGIDAIQQLSDGTKWMKELQTSIGVGILFSIATFAVSLAATKYKSEARKQVS